MSAEPHAPMDLASLVHLPGMETDCGEGAGMAVCPALGLLVTSSVTDNSLHIFQLSLAPTGPAPAPGAGGFTCMGTMGGHGAPPPMDFLFDSFEWGGFMLPGCLAFAGPAGSPTLLVADGGHDAIHIVDVEARSHKGYMAAPGTIPGPRGVAARASWAAASSWTVYHEGDHVVHVFERRGPHDWALLRVLGAGFGAPGVGVGQLHAPTGLRFARDGVSVVVADSGNHRLCLFRVTDGTFTQSHPSGFDMVSDVEQGPDGWLVAVCGANTVLCISGAAEGGASGRDGLEVAGAPWSTWHGWGAHRFQEPMALALVPGLGLLVRDSSCWSGGRVHVFATPDAIAVAAMSIARVAWMASVARAMQRSRPVF